MKRLLLFIVIVRMFFALNVFSATLDIQGGILFGASDVDVNGVLYDVSFQDGTAIDLYGGADANSDFPFNNASNPSDTTLAYMAAQALLDQVFTGDFDTSPSLINGIGAPGGGEFYIPAYLQAGNQIGIISARNYSNENSDVVRATYYDITTDTSMPGVETRFDGITYAVWSLAEPVPAPSAIILLGFGLLGLAGVSRSRKIN